MQPVEKLCNSNGNPRLTGTIPPCTDDVAALNRLYPVTAANAVTLLRRLQLPLRRSRSRELSVFRPARECRGGNVVATPLISGTNNPDMQYPASTVSRSLFTGHAAN